MLAKVTIGCRGCGEPRGQSWGGGSEQVEVEQPGHDRRACDQGSDRRRGDGDTEAEAGEAGQLAQGSWGTGRGPGPGLDREPLAVFGQAEGAAIGLGERVPLSGRRARRRGGAKEVQRGVHVPDGILRIVSSCRLARTRREERDPGFNRIAGTVYPGWGDRVSGSFGTDAGAGTRVGRAQGGIPWGGWTRARLSCWGGFAGCSQVVGCCILWGCE